jgi:hypothetical protein
VTASGGLVALQAGGSTTAVVASALAGLVVGLLLLVFLVWVGRDFGAR